MPTEVDQVTCDHCVHDQYQGQWQDQSHERVNNVDDPHGLVVAISQVAYTLLVDAGREEAVRVCR